MWALFTALFATAASIVAFAYRAEIQKWFFAPTASTIESGKQNGVAKAPEAVAEGLEIPWELAFLPGGDMLVTERPGRLLRIGADKKMIPVSGVAHRGEGGLLGLALHPDFGRNGYIYLYLTTAEGGGLTNRVERYVLNGTALSKREIIIENIPGAANHDGGRIAFGPDGMLYITTGDAGSEERAQDTKSLAGKILRVRDDGSIPSDNPFTSTGSVQAAAVYSYGHRNVQGIAWDETGQLWATEHGRSGVRSGFDEVNKIEKGGNYGWPDIEGAGSRAGMITPQVHSGASETWAPSGITYLHGHIIFAGLRGESLYSADVSNGAATTVKSHLRGEYGRLRTVVVGPDGMLYILTNNRDGRGSPGASDDRIMKLDPAALGF